ncbi:MAG: hypothetical protein Q9227_009153 [Pyrenula ochraceoflavens]
MVVGRSTEDVGFGLDWDGIERARNTMVMGNKKGLACDRVDTSSHKSDKRPQLRKPQPQKSDFKVLQREDYTPDVVSNRMVCLQEYRSRNLAPQSRNLLQVYETWCTCYQSEKDLVRRIMWQHFIQLQDRKLEKTPLVVFDDISNTLARRLVEYRTYDIFAKYSDYYGPYLTELKKEADYRQTQDSSEFKEYWRQVWRQLRQEKAYVLSTHMPSFDKVPTFIKVIDISKKMKLSAAYICGLISDYADRVNPLNHSNINKMLQEGHTRSFGEQAWQDRYNLCKWFSSDQAPQMAAVETAADFLINTVFMCGNDEDRIRPWEE